MGEVNEEVMFEESEGLRNMIEELDTIVESNGQQALLPQHPPLAKVLRNVPSL